MSRRRLSPVAAQDAASVVSRDIRTLAIPAALQVNHGPGIIGAAPATREMSMANVDSNEQRE